MSVQIKGVGTISGIDQGLNIVGTTTTGQLNVTGVSTFVGDVDIADKIIHTGDTDTAIRFPAADTITTETGGGERLRITSDGRVLINSTTSRNIGANITRMLQIESSGGGAGIAVVRNSNNTSGPSLDLGKSRGYPNTIVQSGDKLGVISFSGADGTSLQISGAQITGEVDGTPGQNDMPGRIVFKTTADGASSTTERARITSDGYFGVNTDTPTTNLQIGDGTVDSDNVIKFGKRVTTSETNLPLIGQHSYNGASNGLGLCATSSSGVISFFTGNNANGFGEGGNNEYMRIQSNGEIAMRSNGDPTDALAGLHVQNGNFRVSQAAGPTTEYFQIQAHTHNVDGDRHVLSNYSNGTLYSHITKNGQIGSLSSHFAGRTKTDANSPSNYYAHGSYSFNAYSGRTDDTTNYRTLAYMRAWDGGDTADRNVIYYTDSGSDTTTNDYDQHQKFGVKANGMAQFGSHVFAGRVESDEGSPNSVYTGVSGTAMIAYPTSGSQYTRIDARTTDNTDQVFKVDTGGGVVIKFQSNGDGRFDGGADIGAASDYAEYFEWLDGNTSSADRRGMTVVMDGEKIRPATDSDDTSKIIGVVSAKPAVVGDSAWSEWQLAHLKDAYGSWVTEDKEYLVWNKFGTFTDKDGVKKTNPQPNINDYNRDADYQVLVSEIEAEKAKGNVPQAAIDQNLRVTKPSRIYNPDYDKTRTYVPRSERKEWDAIGLMGKLVVRRGQPVGTNWILMKSNVGTDPNDSNIILDKYLVR